MELTEVLMYEVHYDYIENKYGNNFVMLFTDTDSLMYEIKTEDVSKEFSYDKEIFEFNCDNSKKLWFVR